jgi:hypothetical protein
MPPTSRQGASEPSWRSGLEEQIGGELTAAGIAFTFEQLTIPYTQPVKARRYTPDFLLYNGIIIESKGQFVSADRQKHLLIQEQYPDLDIRFVFSNPNTRIGKKSKTTYGMWSETKGFLYAKGHIPRAWLVEPMNEASWQRAQRIMKEMKKEMKK